MGNNVGSYDISFLLEAKAASIKDIGEQTVIDILQADVDAHNTIVQEMFGDLCEFSSDAVRLAGVSTDVEGFEVDEYGRAPTQRVESGYNIGFPLKRWQFAVGWTRRFLETSKAADVAQKQLSAEKAHKRYIEDQIKKAIFRKTNFTFRDYNVDNVNIDCYRFVNADSKSIPEGPNGETFTAATHDHYRSTGTVAVADYQNLIDTVVEHGHGSQIKLYINRADEAAMTGYTGFVDAIDIAGLVVPGGYASLYPQMGLDNTKLDDRFIGRLKGAQVWTKPWVPANYAFCFAAGDSRKPLVFRQRSQGGYQGLRVAASLDTHPLQADYFEAELGIGVWTRTNGAVLYIGNDTWADGI